MSEAKYVTVGTVFHAVLLALIGVLICLVGPIGHSIVFCLAILLTLVFVRLCIDQSVRLLNRSCRFCRESSSAAFSHDAATAEIDAEAERLKSVAAAMRREEQACQARYSQCHCSPEDLVRARSLRVQAEIERLRYSANALSQFGRDYHS